MTLDRPNPPIELSQFTGDQVFTVRVEMAMSQGQRTRVILLQKRTPPQKICQHLPRRTPPTGFALRGRCHIIYRTIKTLTLAPPRETMITSASIPYNTGPEVNTGIHKLTAPNVERASTAPGNARGRPTSSVFNSESFGSP